MAGYAATEHVPPAKPSVVVATYTRRTPFAPSAPTPTSVSDITATVAPSSWPEPNTYGGSATAAIPIAPPAEPFTFPEGSLNILLLGSDRRSGPSFRTDTILILSVQPAAGVAALISVPRDLYVYLPGYTVSRINTAWIYGESLHVPGGGPQLLFDTVRYNLGIPVDRYALVEMYGFRQVVEIVGGIDVRVPCEYTDWRLRRPDLPDQLGSSWALFTVPQGVIHMDGDFALWYARSRARSSDFDRARRQQEVLRGLYRAGLRPDILARIPELYAALQSSVRTNISLEDVLGLAPFVTRLEPSRLRSRFIGRGQVRQYRVPTSGAFVLLPEAAAIRSLLEEALAPTDQDSALATPPRVEVVWSGRRQLALLAQERLLYAGFEAVVIDEDPPPGSTTRLLVSNAPPPEASARILAALGLPSEAAIAWSEAEATTSFRLVVDDDYDPCFDPSTS
ncbi:MAG TPA: LCP family protein [Anaerolineales bacterium]|nr:LCP family protein [Anaerolineales bacterium]